jgi:hypothetical protein
MPNGAPFWLTQDIERDVRASDMLKAKHGTAPEDAGDRVVLTAKQKAQKMPGTVERSRVPKDVIIQSDILRGPNMPQAKNEEESPAQLEETPADSAPGGFKDDTMVENQPTDTLPEKSTQQSQPRNQNRQPLAGPEETLAPQIGLTNPWICQQNPVARQTYL